MARAIARFALLTMLAAVPAPPLTRAADAPGAASGPRIDAVVPVDPHEHERLHFFDKRPHHLLPGTVTIDRKPYACDVDGQRFADEDAFVAHLRTAHAVRPREAADAVTVRDGVIHFSGK